MKNNIQDETYIFKENKNDYKVRIELFHRTSENGFFNWIRPRINFYDNENKELDFDYSNNKIYFSIEECFIQRRLYKFLHKNNYNDYYNDYEVLKQLIDNDFKILKHLIEILPSTFKELKEHYQKSLLRKAEFYRNRDIMLLLNESYLKCVNSVSEKDYIDCEDCDERNILHTSDYIQNKIDFLLLCRKIFKKDKADELIIYYKHNDIFVKELTKIMMNHIGFRVIKI